MDAAAGHPRVFVRSLASRGQGGGLSRTAVDVAAVLGHLGFDRVLVETVGAGQSDIEIGEVADAVLVLAVPGFGDEVQAAKAGILEIGDVCAVNKCDLPGAATIVGHLETNLDLIYSGRPGRNPAGQGVAGAPLPGNALLHERHGDRTNPLGHWRPPVVAVSARDGTGIETLAVAIEGFVAWLDDTGRRDSRLADRLRAHTLRIVQARLLDRCLDAVEAKNLDLGALSAEMAAGSLTPDEAADRILAVTFGDR
jgi:LAO/AO transport system kinase